ncbi:hypothetical protein DCAR_0310833 [Daucus carota subsp. sativus]|uniref:Uncharacterized protein n=1 Tax=Daucus carota subsp. sativus TaxID=79200 RepID=A0A166A7Q7_DAUCS|nr:hypothetical protein DCAR_0310833 [Daucus carota subsp. sativus]
MEALNTYADARAPVAPAASGVVADDPNQRQRFFVELAPDETTIVSWKALVQEANNGVVADDSSNEKEELDVAILVEPRGFTPSFPFYVPSYNWFAPTLRHVEEEDNIQVEKSRIKEGGSIVKRDIVRHMCDKEKSSISLEVLIKTMRKVIMDSVTSGALPKLHDLKSAQHDLPSRSSMNKMVSPTVLLDTSTESSSSADSSATTSLLASSTSAFHETIVVSAGASSTKKRCL